MRRKPKEVDGWKNAIEETMLKFGFRIIKVVGQKDCHRKTGKRKFEFLLVVKSAI